LNCSAFLLPYRGRSASTAYVMSQRAVQIGIRKLISDLGEFLRQDLLARQQHLIGHFTKGHPRRERRYGQRRRTIQDMSQSAGELLVRHRIWRDYIQGTVD